MWVDFGLLDQPEELEKDKAEQLEAVKPASFSSKTIAQGAKMSAGLTELPWGECVLCFSSAAGSGPREEEKHPWEITASHLPVLETAAQE